MIRNFSVQCTNTIEQSITGWTWCILRIEGKTDFDFIALEWLEWCFKFELGKALRKYLIGAFECSVTKHEKLVWVWRMKQVKNIFRTQDIFQFEWETEACRHQPNNIEFFWIVEININFLLTLNFLIYSLRGQFFNFLSHIFPTLPGNFSRNSLIGLVH